MTVGNASSSYCYSILLTVFCSLVLASTSPLITPTHASDSQSNKGKIKTSHTKTSYSELEFTVSRVWLDSQLISGLLSLSQKQQNKQ